MVSDNEIKKMKEYINRTYPHTPASHKKRLLEIWMTPTKSIRINL